MPDRLHATCPYCGSHTGCSEAPAHGFMERTVLRALGFRPYLCSACGHHRVLFVGLGARPPAAEESGPHPVQPDPDPGTHPGSHSGTQAAAPAAPKEEFKSLIREIHRKEASLIEPHEDAPSRDESLPWKKDG